MTYTFGINGWASDLLKHANPGIYFLVLYVVLLFGFWLWFRSKSQERSGFWKRIGAGLLIGYFAGMTGYLAMSLSLADGWSRLTNSIFVLPDGPLTLLAQPMVYLSWLIGLVTAIVGICIEKLIDQSIDRKKK